jgi:chromosome segregation ATPase
MPAIISRVFSKSFVIGSATRRIVLNRTTAARPSAPAPLLGGIRAISTPSTCVTVAPNANKLEVAVTDTVVANTIINAYKTEIERLRGHNETLTAEKHRLEGQVATHQAQMTKFEADVDKVNKQNEALSADAQRLDKVVVQLQSYAKRVEQGHEESERLARSFGQLQQEMRLVRDSASEHYKHFSDAAEKLQAKVTRWEDKTNV